MLRYIVEVPEYPRYMDEFKDLMDGMYVIEECTEPEETEYTWWDVREDYIDDALNDYDLLLDIPKEKLMLLVRRHYKTQRALINDYRRVNNDN